MKKVPEPKALRAEAAALRNAASLQRADIASGNYPMHLDKAYHVMAVQGLDREAAKLDAQANQIELDN